MLTFLKQEQIGQDLWRITYRIGGLNNDHTLEVNYAVAQLVQRAVSYGRNELKREISRLLSVSESGY